jgi:hypothetical protein
MLIVCHILHSVTHWPVLEFLINLFERLVTMTHQHLDSGPVMAKTKTCTQHVSSVWERESVLQPASSNTIVAELLSRHVAAPDAELKLVCVSNTPCFHCSTIARRCEGLDNRAGVQQSC